MNTTNPIPTFEKPSDETRTTQPSEEWAAQQQVVLVAKQAVETAKAAIAELKKQPSWKGLAGLEKELKFAEGNLAAQQQILNTTPGAPKLSAKWIVTTFVYGLQQVEGQFHRIVDEAAESIKSRGLETYQIETLAKFNGQNEFARRVLESLAAQGDFRLKTVYFTVKRVADNMQQRAMSNLDPRNATINKGLFDATNLNDLRFDTGWYYIENAAMNSEDSDRYEFDDAELFTGRRQNDAE